MSILIGDTGNGKGIRLQGLWLRVLGKCKLQCWFVDIVLETASTASLT